MDSTLESVVCQPSHHITEIDDESSRFQLWTDPLSICIQHFKCLDIVWLLSDHSHHYIVSLSRLSPPCTASTYTGHQYAHQDPSLHPQPLLEVGSRAPESQQSGTKSSSRRSTP